MCVLKKLQKGIITKSSKETIKLAFQLADVLPKDYCLALYGKIGVGKTTFVAGIAKNWSIKEIIKSPSFTVYNIYQGVRQLIHLDAYRLNGKTQADFLMLEEFLISPYCLIIEWPNNIISYLPKKTLHIVIEIINKNLRRIKLK